MFPSAGDIRAKGAPLARLVTDIGGTHTRLGLSRGGQLDSTTVRRFANDDFDGIEAVLTRYLGTVPAPSISTVVLAVAGPVTGARARLTNRNWLIDTGDIAAITGGAAVHLVNDLEALGHALAGLGAEDVTTLSSGRPQGGQKLVVNIGTGFNICPVASSETGTFCLRSEAGHAQLPPSISAILNDTLGPGTARPATVEDLFSGPGYAALQALWENRPSTTGGTGYRGLYTRLLAELVTELLLNHLPLAGIWFTGGAARAVLGTEDGQGFGSLIRVPHPLPPDLSIPLHLITGDSAALVGCALVEVG